MKFILTIIIGIYAIINTFYYSVKIMLYKRMGAKIGKNVRLYGILDGVNPHLIEIGDNTVIGKGSCIIAHCPIKGGKRVKIGKNVWMGFGVKVLPGITIGDNTIIGASSVVTSDIPPNVIAARNPARVLRERDKGELERTVKSIEEGKPIGYAEKK